MRVTFKQFTSLIAEGKEAYSSESYWKDDAKEAGYKVKKLSGELNDGDQTWGAFDENDKKVGEFTEKEEGRGGWLIRESQVNEIFGLFRNNTKAEEAKAAREQLKKDTAEKVAAHRAKQAKKNKKPGDEEDEEEEDDKKKKASTQTRSASTKGTKSTQSAAGARAAERDWLNNL